MIYPLKHVDTPLLHFSATEGRHAAALKKIK